MCYNTNIGMVALNEKLSAAIRRVARNDISAVEEIYDSFSKPIYFFAVSYMKDTFTAENIMQDTFIAIIEKAKLFREPQNAKAWILQITKNLCLNKLKRNKLEQRYMSDYTACAAASDFQEALEKSLELTSVLKNLSDEERNLLLLKVEYDLTYEEISSLTGKSQRTLKRHIGTIIEKCKANVTLGTE